MGMFDEVRFTCPECGNDIEVHSKAGECLLIKYYPDEVPYIIAKDIDKKRAKCGSCETVFTVESFEEIQPPPTYAMILTKADVQDNYNNETYLEP
jgi:transcription elongation factor Elf1